MNKKKGLTDAISENDLSFMIIAATRYALGRMTYSTSIMRDVITEGVRHMSDNCISVLFRDIKEHGEHGARAKLENNGYGMECDYQAWMDCLRSLEKEAARRRGK